MLLEDFLPGAFVICHQNVLFVGGLLDVYTSNAVYDSFKGCGGEVAIKPPSLFIAAHSCL